MSEFQDGKGEGDRGHAIPQQGNDLAGEQQSKRAVAQWLQFVGKRHELLGGLKTHSVSHCSLASVPRNEQDMLIRGQLNGGRRGDGKMERIQRPKVVLGEQTVCQGKRELSIKTQKRDRAIGGAICIEPLQE